MPRFPEFSARVGQLPGSVFEKFRPRMRALGKKLIRLHIGDTYLPPQFPLPLVEEFAKQFPDFNRYCNTFGVMPLRRVLVEKLKEDNGFSVTAENVLITSGATNALSASTMALVEPGEEVLVLTPAWPFLFGMVKAAGGIVREVPFYTELFEHPEMDIEGYLEPFLSERTVALYLNTPNNPSGKVLNRSQLEALARLCRKHQLWIISDEAYDGLTFDGHPHLSIATLPEMFAQTLSIFTFSKIYMFAGLRLGYLVGSEPVVRAVNKTMVHQLYSPATISQYLMIEPVQNRKQWQESVRKHYQQLRDLFVENLKVDLNVPEGTYFLFFSVEPYLQGKTIWEFIDRCFDVGVSVAPGKDFGRHFQNYIRLCFTGEPPERLKLAIERLNRLFSS